MIMRRNPIVLAFNIVCLLPKINRKTLEFKLAELPMGGRDAPPPYLGIYLTPMTTMKEVAIAGFILVRLG